jgi:hypothetical protein
VRVAAAVLLCLALCFPSWTAAASACEASFNLTEQSLDTLREEGLPKETLKKLEALKDQKFDTEDEFLEAVRQAIGKDQTVRYKKQILKYAADDIAEIKRITEVLQAQKAAIAALQAQNLALMKRLAELEAAQKERAQEELAQREREQREREQREREQRERARKQAEAERQLRVEAEKKEQKQLEQRVKELEDAETARDEATRSIIRDALSTVGSKINEAVTLGGTFEVVAGRANDFDNQWDWVLGLNTVEFDFEIQPNDWTWGFIKLEYDDGTNVTFPTNSGFDTSVDRINLEQAFFTIGDPQRFPPFLTAGRIILPFGVSTGDPVADVLTIEDPLTIEVFEFRETMVGLGLGFPTPAFMPATPPVTPPPVRPLVINPLVSSFSRFLGYKPPPTPPAALTPIIPTPAPPLFNLAVYSFDGETFESEGDSGRWDPGEHYGATAGFRTKGSCGRPYDQLVGSALCPWTFDIDVDYNNSVFDSRFLRSEYQDFLGQIGFVPGMAAHVKSSFGPVALVGEWNGAISSARFTDDLGNSVSIRPSAWQVSLGYQFDWNPWVEAIGAQGDYLAIGYSQSHDLGGVTQEIADELSRIGFVPKRRILVGAGEWVLDNLLLAIEYSYNKDYPGTEGGTSNTAHGFFTQLTTVW